MDAGTERMSRQRKTTNTNTNTTMQDRPTNDNSNTLNHACPYLGKPDAAGGANKVVHHPVVVDDVELESEGVEADGLGDVEG